MHFNSSTSARCYLSIMPRASGPGAYRQSRDGLTCPRVLDVEHDVDNDDRDHGEPKDMQPTPLWAARHPITGQKGADKPQAEQKSINDSGRMNLQGQRAGRGDINHVVERRWRQPVRGRMRIREAGGERRLTQQSRFRAEAFWNWPFRVRPLHIRELAISLEPRAEVSPKQLLESELLYRLDRRQARNEPEQFRRLTISALR